MQRYPHLHVQDYMFHRHGVDSHATAYENGDRGGQGVAASCHAADEVEMSTDDPRTL